jgi:hypothetical protein
MRLVPIALVLLSLPVSAQPAPPERTTCLVALTGAPDEVRAIVDAWLRAEPRCGAALDVTVTPVEGGYLLDARDARGGRRVRFAPDAQIAGALIASWAADGSIVLSRPDDSLAEPTAPGVVVPAVTSPPPRPPDPDHRVLLGVVVGAAQGVRGEIDVVALGRHVRLGVAMGARTGTARSYGVEHDLAASGYLGLGFATARWQLRVELGAGVQRTELQLYSTTNQVWASTAERLLATDASLTASRDVAPGWAVTGGVLINVLPDPSHTMLDRVAPMALIGVSCRL